MENLKKKKTSYKTAAPYWQTRTHENNAAIKCHVKQDTDIRVEVVQTYQPEVKIKYKTTASIIKLFLKQYCRNCVCEMKTATLKCTRNSKSHLPNPNLPLSYPNLTQHTVSYHTEHKPSLPYPVLPCCSLAYFNNTCMIM